MQTPEILELPSSSTGAHAPCLVFEAGFAAPGFVERQGGMKAIVRCSNRLQPWPHLKVIDQSGLPVSASLYRIAHIVGNSAEGRAS